MMIQPPKKRKLNDSPPPSLGGSKYLPISPPETNDTPHIEADELSKTFEDLGIVPELVQACTSLKWTQPRPIQVESIPLALEGRDVIGLAETGSGKTAAFGLPMLQALLQNPMPYFGLVLAPTRELAVQIKQHIEALGSIINVRCILIMGGEGMSMMDQAKALQKNPHVIIATPGRLVDHLKNTKGFHLRNLKFLVLDEADKLLDMGFMESLTDILKALPRERQTCLFSATMTDKVGTLQRAALKNPALVSASRNKTVRKLVQQFAMVPSKYKDHALFYVLEVLNKGKRIIVFCRRIQKVQELCHILRALHVPAIPLHSQLGQEKRSAALAKFVREESGILIATDVAARGLDIPSVDLVVNFNVPDTGDTYVHRVGRTARAGKTGKALTLVDQYEVFDYMKIEKYLETKLDQVELPKDEYTVLGPSIDEAQIVAKREMKREAERMKRGGRHGGKRRRGDDQDADEG